MDSTEMEVNGSTVTDSHETPIISEDNVGENPLERDWESKQLGASQVPETPNISGEAHGETSMENDSSCDQDENTDSVEDDGGENSLEAESGWEKETANTGVTENPNISETATEETSVENGSSCAQGDNADSLENDGGGNPLEGGWDSEQTGTHRECLNSVDSCEDSENSGFPSIMCAETISEDAFEEEERNDELTKTKENDDVDKSAAIVSEELSTDEKEQEPVNESSETDNKDTEDGQSEKELPVKQEPALFSDYDGDQPNEDPNTEEAADSDQEMDPEIAAAMEASLLETEAMDEEEAASATPSGSKFMFRDETAVDSAAEDSAEVDSLDNGALGSLTEEDIELAGEAVTAEMEIGSTEIGAGHNPLEAGDGNPLDDPGDYDPFEEEEAGIAVDEDTNGFLDKVNSGFMTQIHSFPEHEALRSTRGPRGPYKKTRERFTDADFDPLSGPSRPRVRPSRAKGQLSCHICHFPFDVIGELKLHKYTDHENQPKPSYLDLTEVAIGKLSTKNGGASQIKILKEITSDPMTTDTNAKAKFILAKALKFGVEMGRLRLGKPGKTTQRYYLAKKGVRKAAHEKFNKNKKLVEFDEAAVRNPPKPKAKPKPAGPSSSELRNLLPSHISITPVSAGPSQASHISQPDPKKFGRGKRTAPGASSSGGGDQIGMKRNGIKRKPMAMPIGEITLDSDSDSDDDIAIISEKITKPKKKITIVRVAPGKAKGKQTPVGKKLPSSMIKVGSALKPKPMSSGQVKKPAPVEKIDDDDDDEDFSCRVCQAVFWFKGQLVDHLKSTHNVENPDKYLKIK